MERTQTILFLTRKGFTGGHAVFIKLVRSWRSRPQSGPLGKSQSNTTGRACVGRGMVVFFVFFSDPPFHRRPWGPLFCKGDCLLILPGHYFLGPWFTEHGNALCPARSSHWDSCPAQPLLLWFSVPSVWEPADFLHALANRAI